MCARSFTRAPRTGVEGARGPRLTAAAHGHFSPQRERAALPPGRRTLLGEHAAAHGRQQRVRDSRADQLRAALDARVRVRQQPRGRAHASGQVVAARAAWASDGRHTARGRCVGVQVCRDTASAAAPEHPQKGAAAPARRARLSSDTSSKQSDSSRPDSRSAAAVSGSSCSSVAISARACSSAPRAACARPPAAVTRLAARTSGASGSPGSCFPRRRGPGIVYASLRLLNGLDQGAHEQGRHCCHEERRERGARQQRRDAEQQRRRVG